jgi:membrane-associated phospholipid phosphatase
MFETDLHAWLQVFDVTWMVRLMRAVTFLGYDWIYPVIVLSACFAGRLRPGLTVTLSLMLAAVAIHGGKAYFELPRPSDVDARLLDGGELHTPIYPGGSAHDAWSLPAPGAVAALRATPDPDYGFPSGHVGATVAAWLGLCLAYGWRRRTWALALAWGLVMAISRMYLGRHFLADVVGGLVIGIWAAGAAALAMSQRRSRLIRGIAILSMIACVAVFHDDLIDIGKLAGLVVAIAWFEWRGYPAERGGWAFALARVAIGAACYVVLRWAAHYVPLPGVLIAGMTTAVMFIGAVALGLLLRCFTASPIHHRVS